MPGDMIASVSRRRAYVVIGVEQCGPMHISRRITLFNVWGRPPDEPVIIWMTVSVYTKQEYYDLI